MSRRRRVPTYRKKTVRGNEYALVCLVDSENGRRRECMLGKYGSPESREMYLATVANWEKAGRRLL